MLKGRHGAGTMTYNNGNVHDGQRRCGHKDGMGIMKYADGAIYDGEWLNDCRHGNGTEANGDVYRGEWIRDQKQKHGIGFLTEAYGGEERQHVYNYGKLLEICSEVILDQSDHSTTARGQRSSLSGSWLVRSRSMSIQRSSQSWELGCYFRRISVLDPKSAPITDYCHCQPECWPIPSERNLHSELRLVQPM